MINYFMAAALSLLISLFLTPLARKISLRFGILDVPRPNKLHRNVIPRAGGLSIFFGFLSAIIYLVVSRSMDPNVISLVILGAAAMLCLGFIDDLRGVSPSIKFAVQFSVALTLALSGLRIGCLPYLFSVPITLFWIVGVTNAINLQDGMDGLAAGISGAASLCFFAVGSIQGDRVIALVSLALAGSCLGFLKYNMFPASIFMGDTGSIFLGYMLSILGILSTAHSSSYISLFVPVLILGIPVFDTLISMLRRFVQHKWIFQPDLGHFYNLMLDSKRLSYEQVIIVIYIFSILLGVSSLCLL